MASKKPSLFSCCSAPKDAPPPRKKTAPAPRPRQPSPEKPPPEELVAPPTPEPEAKDEGKITCGGNPNEACRRLPWNGILPHQLALLCPLHAPAPTLEQVPEEALEIIKDGVETDMPLRCAQALQFHLKDVTAAPYAICDIRRGANNTGEIIGTEWRTLRGRYKWGMRDGEVGEDELMIVNLFTHANRRNAVKCCAYFALLEGHQAKAGVGSDMYVEGQSFKPPPPFWPKGGIGGHKWRPYDMRPPHDPTLACGCAEPRPQVAPPEPPLDDDEVTVPFNDWHAIRDKKFDLVCGEPYEKNTGS